MSIIYCRSQTWNRFLQRNSAIQHHEIWRYDYLESFFTSIVNGQRISFKSDVVLETFANDSISDYVAWSTLLIGILWIEGTGRSFQLIEYSRSSRSDLGFQRQFHLKNFSAISSISTTACDRYWITYYRGIREFNSMKYYVTIISRLLWLQVWSVRKSHLNEISYIIFPMIMGNSSPKNQDQVLRYLNMLHCELGILQFSEPSNLEFLESPNNPWLISTIVS
jgi:hypothetical protein